MTRFDFSGIKEDLESIAGGVPCQPPSSGGKHKGTRDDRNPFRRRSQDRPRRAPSEGRHHREREGSHTEGLPQLLSVHSTPASLSRDRAARRRELERTIFVACSNITSPGSSHGLHYFVEAIPCERRQLRDPSAARTRVHRRLPLGPRRRVAVPEGDAFAGRPVSSEKYVTCVYRDRVGIPPVRKAVPEYLRARGSRGSSQCFLPEGKALEDGA